MKTVAPSVCYIMKKDISVIDQNIELFMSNIFLIYYLKTEHYLFGIYYKYNLLIILKICVVFENCNVTVHKLSRTYIPYYSLNQKNRIL